MRSGWKRSKSVSCSPLEANDALEERLGRHDGVLADHRVDDEEDLVGRDGVADVGGLLHQLGIDAEPTRGVDDHDVVQLASRLLDGGPRHRDGITDAVAGLGSEDRDADALTVDLELLDGVGTLQVAGHQQRGLALLLQPQGELGRQRGLARTLQAGQHDHGRAGLGVAQSTGLPAEDGDELLVDDLDDLLGRVQRLADLRAAGPLLDVADERLDDGQRDVGLEQRDPDLARGGVDVGLGEPTLAPKVLEGVGEPVGECGEQRGSSLR